MQISQLLSDRLTDKTQSRGRESNGRIMRIKKKNCKAYISLKRKRDNLACKKNADGFSFFAMMKLGLTVVSTKRLFFFC